MPDRPRIAESEHEVKTCPTCDGAGEVDTGRREHDTGGTITAKCHRCDGTGRVPAGRLIGTLIVALLMLLGAAPAVHAAPATAEQTVAVFGDSVSTGAWLCPSWTPGVPCVDESKSWVGLLAAKHPDLTFRNYAAGGMALHQTDTWEQQLLGRIKSTAAAWKTAGEPVPATVIVAIGTNDVMGHTLEAPPWSGQALYYSEWAATNVHAFLKSIGVKRILWNTVYPWAAAAPSNAHPGYVLPQWVAPLMWRTSSFNNWLTAMYGADVINTGWTLMDWQCWCMGDTSKMVDGFHPNAIGHANVAWAFDRTVKLEP